MTTVRDIYDYINEIAPFDSAEEWDNSGLMIGDMAKPVSKVVLSLDGTRLVADFALSVSADLLITHHPVIFSGLTNIKKDSAVYKLINGDVSVISAHTCYDKAPDGINTHLAAIIGLQDTQRLDNSFVVTGELPEPMSIDDFASYVGELLESRALRYTDTDKLIKRVAVGGGACAEFIDEAMQNADCFLTGDLKYHEMLDASEQGYAVISAGHFETENAPFLMLADRLRDKFNDVEFIVSPQHNIIMEI